MTSSNNVTLHVTSQLPTLAPPLDGSIRGLEEIDESHIVILQSSIFLLTWAVAVLGNTLVILVIHRSRRVQSTTNFFVISIAVSDMAFVLFSVPFVCARVIMQEWAAGHVFCRLARFVQFSSMSSTSFILVAICFDRFYTIIYPLSFKVTRGTSKRMIIAAWLVSAVLSCMCIYFFDHVEVRNLESDRGTRYVCPTFIPSKHWSGVFYAGVCVIVQFLCPLVLVTIGYSRISCYIWSMRSRARRCRRSNNPVPRAKVKMVKMLMILSYLTLLLYLPYYITQILYCFSYTRYLSPDVFISFFWLISASAVVKPVVYACGNSNFWRGCKEVLCMSTMKCYRINNYTVTNASVISKRNYVGVLDLSKEQISISIDSPIEAFNRTKYKAKAAWPINGSLPSTTL